MPYATLILFLCSAGLPINVNLQGASEIEKGYDQPYSLEESLNESVPMRCAEQCMGYSYHQ